MMGQTMTEQDKTGPLPEWIRVLPLGRVELADSREPLEVDKASLDAVVAAFQSQGVDLVIDYEHQSLQGQRAPAAGWIKNLEVRNDGLWARVEWTPQAMEYLLKREYRYFSPVLRLEPGTRKPLSLMHLGLTNVPAIKQVPPLVAKLDGQEASPRDGGGLEVEVPPMEFGAAMESEALLELKKLLGLSPGDGAGAVWRRALEGFRELGAALDLPADVSWSRLQGVVEALKVGAAGADKLRQELQGLQSRLAAETAARVVQEALKAGKVSPAQRQWALEYFRRDPEGFQAYVSRAPKVVPAGEELKLLQEEPEVRDGLAPEELAICRALKILPAAYLKARAKSN